MSYPVLRTTRKEEPSWTQTNEVQANSNGATQLLNFLVY